MTAAPRRAPAPPAPAHPARSHAWALLGYTLAALLLTWPMARDFASHVPGDGIDDPALAWNLWWVQSQLVERLNLDIFHAQWMFHPVGVNLAFYTLTPLNGLISVPLQAAFGLVVANNLILLSSFVLGGYGTWLLARAAIGRHAEPWAAQGAAFAGGFLYAFAAPKLFYAALGQFNIASSQWLPFCALYLVRLLHARTVRAAVRSGALAGLFLVFQAWAELTFASFLLLLFGLAAAAALWLVARERRRLAPLAAGFAAAALLFAVGMTPYLWAMLPDLRSEGDFFASGGGFADLYSADLAGFLRPTRLHPLWGDAAAAQPFANDKGQQLWLGYTGVALALLGIGWLWPRRRRMALFWGVALPAFLWLSLGPSLRWMGRDLGIPGPFALISQLPFFNGNRYPSRYSIVVLLCLGVLAAAGMAGLLARLRAGRRSAGALTVAIIALFVAEHLSLPLPLSDLRTPPLYAQLAQEPGDGALLELPTGWRNGARVLGRSDLLIMAQQWYQTAHGKRRLGGNTSRNPPQKFQFFTEHPLIGDLIALMNADQEHMAPVRAEVDTLIERHAPTAAQALADLGVRWVTLHEQQATPELVRFVEQALPLRPIERWPGDGQVGPIRLYAVQPPDPIEATRSFDLAPPEGAAYLAEGWSPASAALRYANRDHATLVLPLPESAAVFTLAPPGAAPPVVRVNGTPLVRLPERTDADAYALPAGLATEPVDRITLHFPGGGAPVTSLATSPQPIGQTGALWPAGATLLAQSAGEEVGDFAHLWIDGVDVATPARGYSLAALAADGRLLAVGHFDTHASGEASAAMAAWLAQWPPGTVVTGAVNDEASLHLTQAAVDALRALGIGGDLRGRFRASHAFVGVAGSAPGAAREQVTQTRPALVWLGAPLDGARVHGGYARAAVEPQSAP